MDVSRYAGQVGDPIVIRASDDFEVKDVGVALTRGDGRAIESGAALEQILHRYSLD